MVTTLRETITLERAHEHWEELLNLDSGLYHVRFNQDRWSKDFLGHITSVHIWSDRQRAERQNGAEWEFRPVFTVLAWKDMDVARLPTAPAARVLRPYETGLIRRKAILKAAITRLTKLEKRVNEKLYPKMPEARNSFPYKNELDRFYVTGGAEFDKVGLDFLPVVLGWRWHDTTVDKMLKEGFPRGLKRKEEVAYASRTR